MASRSVLPSLTLMALATIVPELFTGSTPLWGFGNPALLVFLLLAYGLPVLLIRELAVRCHVGLAGLVLLGIAYGIFNEGLLAKTVLLETKLPVSAYDHYGYALGISFPWLAGISVWHSFASVVFPILLTQHFFPQRRESPWLNGKLSLTGGALLTLLACAVFLGTSQTNGAKGTPGQLALLLALMAALMFLGACWKGNVVSYTGTAVAKPILLGLSVFVPFWGLAMVAGSKWPSAVFFVLLLAIILLYAWILERRGWHGTPAFLFFGLGWYLHNAVQAAVIISLMGNPVLAAVTIAVDLLILLMLFLGLRPRAVTGPDELG